MRRHDREVTDKNEIKKILLEGDVCHLAFFDGTEPYIVTMNYGFFWDEKLSLYFHSAKEGRKIDIIPEHPMVCFSIDTGHELVSAKHACGWSMKYKSLVGTGLLELVADPDEKIRGMNLLMEHYAGEAGPYNYENRILEQTTVLRLQVNSFSGKEKK
ncbi:pyridoxamine 5'-phosphate oxidase family protein [Brucepastera parasyntrophica]|uniref:pyridoxamine 5'-phosphate oxidase family protein n=1 Tax=Brucepastera parasyntrophica TaxID=2880008 RepID=UPI00210B5BE5|nr:pyridoxamine 5'-phosphate oxidase family protein [Brucepastera parasyntrophica]ULQ59526.1 pyridoxamine 5'-phosphate oxidase family protein [Brucepastera parasyntrophica]